MNSNTTLEEVWALFRETDRKIKDLAEESKERQRETDRQLRELGKQIGGLGNKFGSFTEGLALPSMEKILRRRFGVDTIAPSVRVSRGGQHLELDVLAYANGEINAAYVVEVKSHLRESTGWSPSPREGLDRVPAALVLKYRHEPKRHRFQRPSQAPAAGHGDLPAPAGPAGAELLSIEEQRIEDRRADLVAKVKPAQGDSFILHLEIQAIRGEAER